MWPCEPFCGLLRRHVASYVLDVAFQGHDYVWPYQNQHGLVCPFMALVALFMALNGILWSFMAECRLFLRSQIQIHLVLLQFDNASQNGEYQCMIQSVTFLYSRGIYNFSTYQPKFPVRFFWIVHTFLVLFWYFIAMRHLYDRVKASIELIACKSALFLLSKCLYRFNQNKPSGVQHTYVLNEFSTADCSCTTRYFWKNSYRSLQSTSLRFIWYLLPPNWSII